MKRFIKMLAVTSVAALALTAMAAAGASAATFTASGTGSLTGTQTSDQVFKTTAAGSNNVTCKKAHTHGTIVSLASEQQHVTITYSECTANFFGFPFKAEVTPATYLFTANGTVHVENTIKIHVPGLGCETIVKPQTRTVATYTNKSGGQLEVHANVHSIVSEGVNGCPGGTDGTYVGSNRIERVGGGTISWDA